MDSNSLCMPICDPKVRVQGGEGVRWWLCGVEGSGVGRDERGVRDLKNKIRNNMSYGVERL